MAPDGRREPTERLVSCKFSASFAKKMQHLHGWLVTVMGFQSNAIGNLRKAHFRARLCSLLRAQRQPWWLLPHEINVASPLPYPIQTPHDFPKSDGADAGVDCSAHRDHQHGRGVASEQTAPTLIWSRAVRGGRHAAWD